MRVLFLVMFSLVSSLSFAELPMQPMQPGGVPPMVRPVPPVAPPALGTPGLQPGMPYSSRGVVIQRTQVTNVVRINQHGGVIAQPQPVPPMVQPPIAQPPIVAQPCPQPCQPRAVAVSVHVVKSKCYRGCGGGGCFARARCGGRRRCF